MSVQQYSFEDFKKLKKAGEITAQALDFLEDKIKPGITTDYIDKIASEFLRSKNATSAHHHPTRISTSLGREPGPYQLWPAGLD